MIERPKRSCDRHECAVDAAVLRTLEDAILEAGVEGGVDWVEGYAVAMLERIEAAGGLAAERE